MNKYKVKAWILNIRPRPTTLKSPIGRLYLGNIVSEKQKTFIEGWTEIETSNGLVGWCASRYLTLISEEISSELEEVEEPSISIDNYPLDDIEILFGGLVTYRRCKGITDGRTFTYHLMEVDIKNPKLGIYIDPRVAVSETTSFLQKNRLAVAINGDGFYQQKGKTVMAGQSCSKGSLYGQDGQEQTLWISEDKVFSLDKPRRLWDGIGFPNLLVKDGNIQKINKSLTDIRARTAVGVTQDQKTLYLLAIDGKDYFSTAGVNCQETAKILYDLHCDIAILLDSGGSTTMVIQGNDGLPLIVNHPSGENLSHQRSVANHVGIKII